MRRRLNHLARDSKGASAVEYGLIIALIVLAIIGALTVFATATTEMWNDVSDQVVEG